MASGDRRVHGVRARKTEKTAEDLHSKFPSSILVSLYIVLHSGNVRSCSTVTLNHGACTHNSHLRAHVRSHVLLACSRVPFVHALPIFLHSYEFSQLVLCLNFALAIVACEIVLFVIDCWIVCWDRSNWNSALVHIL